MRVQVSDLMTADPVVARADDELATVAGHLVRQRIRHLPVVGADGALIGVVTDHGVFRHGGFVDGDRAFMPYDREGEVPTARAIAEVPDVVVGPDTGLAAALRRLAGSRQDYAVVVEDGRPRGILTEHDVLALALALLPEDARATEEASRPVRTIGEAATVADAAWSMSAHGVRHLVVVDGEGAVVGVVSLGDVRAEPLGDRPLRELVHGRPVHAATLGASLREVARILVDRNVGAVPLLRPGGRAAAILTRRDLLQAAVGGVEAEALFDGEDG